MNEKMAEALIGVHPDLYWVVAHAAQDTTIPFVVHDALRSVEQQREYVRTGVSRTLNSKHLVQSDGFGHAVDLVPLVNGKLRWEWDPIYEVARAVQRAAIAHGTLIIWGAVWDRILNGLGHELESEVQEYADRRRARGKRPFLDGPHFEIEIPR